MDPITPGPPSAAPSRPHTPGAAQPLDPLRLRHSLAARITALVVLVLVATGVASLLIVRQLRALQASFDLLTIVYVEFNRDLTVAYRQSVRVATRIESTSEQRGGEAQRLLSSSAEANLTEALETRSEQVQQARAVLDSAFENPERIGGTEVLGPLRDLQGVVARLEELVAQTAAQPPADVLVDVRTQNLINELFRKLDDQVLLGVRQLGTAVRDTERDTERMIVMLTVATALLGIAAALGVVWTVRPLRRLALGVRQLGRGDWAHGVAVDGASRGDEVSQLAHEFNQMAAALQERERRLIRGERLAAVGQLAAQVTHEIRNPLSSVALNVELLADEIAATSPEAHQLLAKITAEIDRLTSITEDYLGFVRRKNPERVPLDLAAELHSLLDFMAEELAAAGVRVVRELRPAWVLGDAGPLRQAFMNLLRNAREALGEPAAAPDPRGDLLDEGDPPSDRALPAGTVRVVGSTGSPCVTVRVARVGDRVRALVADNGPGLAVAADEAEHIFEAFFTRKPQGTGLGLSIVQQIVQDHEGSVRVASTGPGGTAFEIVLPACDPPAASVSSP